MTIAKALARAWADPDYKNRLISDPAAALADVGVAPVEGKTIKIVGDTQDTVHLVLPLAPPGSGVMSSDDLEKVAAGLGTGGQSVNVVCATVNPGC